PPRGRRRRPHLPGQGQPGGARADTRDVSAARRVAADPGPARPRRRAAVRPGPSSRTGGAMKDGLGDVQSLLVLGATSDLAQAVTRRLVARRCQRVVLAARQPADLSAFADELRSLGATTVETVAFDADRTDDHAALVDAAFDGGDLDVV